MANRNDEKINFVGVSFEPKTFNWIVVLFFLLVFGPYLFVLILGDNDFSSAAGVGDAFSGLTTPFIAFLSTLLLFFAFKAQINANNLISEQFEKQKTDEIYFRLFDSLQTKISYHLPIETNNTNEEFLHHLVKKIHHEMLSQLPSFSRKVLTHQPEIVEDRHYADIIEEYYKGKLISCKIRKEYEKLKKNLISQDENDRWEYLKHYLGSVGQESSKTIEILKSMGYFYFYKSTFERRRELYYLAFYIIKKEHGVFIEGYINNLRLLLGYLNSIKKRDFYLQHLKSNITSFEKVLLFYFLTSDERDDNLKTLVKEFQIIDFDTNMSQFLADSPSIRDYNSELNEIYKY